MLSYADLHKLPEDDRIILIGEAAAAGNLVGVCVDDEPGKPERYIQKIIERFPGVRLIDRFKGPTPGVVTLKFGLEAKQ